MSGMERWLVSVYRDRLPRWLQRALTTGAKDRLREALIVLAGRPGPSTLRLYVRAHAATRAGRWDRAVALWQALAALHARDRRGAPDAPVAWTPSAEEIRHDTHIRDRLRAARIGQAAALHRAGRGRAFGEAVARIVESLPDQRVLKKDRAILDLVALYVDAALREDGVGVGVGAAPERPGGDGLRRLVICLDVFKLSDLHTHARVIVAMAGRLLEHDDATRPEGAPPLEIHLVVTGERYAVSTPVIAPSFDPGNDARACDLVRAALPEAYGTRLHLRFVRRTGLEGVVEACRRILALRPDLVLYGGGHRGLFSNESRVVRHALFARLPTGFFFVQSNNEVDDRLDMVIARGPHPIVGDPGRAAIRVQPYPTAAAPARDGADGPSEAPAARRARWEGRTIVSAIAGIRFDMRLSEYGDRTFKRMFSVLDAAPGTVWHMIGAAEPDRLIGANRHVARRVERGQVVVHPTLPAEAFAARVRGAALFLHLPGFTGGSGGAAIARRAGIPILTFAHSDMSGRQPPETVFADGDVRGWASAARRLMTDFDLWDRTVRAQNAFSHDVRREAAARFHACLLECADLGWARLAGTGARPPPPAPDRARDAP